MEPELVPPELDEPQEDLTSDCDSTENFGKNLYDSSGSNAMDLLSRLLHTEDYDKGEEAHWQWK